MKRKLIQELALGRKGSRLFVEVFARLSEEEPADELGIGYRLLHREPAKDGRPADEWWVNFYPQDIDLLIEALQQAKKIGEQHARG